MDRPKEPTPENYGVTESRVAVFRDPFRITERMLEPPFFQVYLAGTFVLAFVLVYDAIESVGGAILLSFLAWGAFLLGGALVIQLVVLPFEVLWRLTQKDYRASKAFEKARADHRERLAAWFRTHVVWWRSLDGRSFEAELGRLFAERGYEVRWTGESGDEGVDLILRKGSRTVLVQCKAHKNPIGPAPVRELYGTLVHRSDKEAWLVSASSFTSGARRFALGKPIRLLRIDDILREIMSD